MRLTRSTIFLKITATLKWLRIKFHYGKKFDSKAPFYIGRNFKLFIEGGKVEIGETPRISDLCEIQARNSVIEIGKNFNLNSFSRIVAFDKIIIGDSVTIAQFVTILDHDHDYKIQNKKLILDGYKTNPVIIGNNVWIGDKVVITKGVNIGNNVIIGAGSVITKNIESNVIVAGNPLKILKKL